MYKLQAMKGKALSVAVVTLFAVALATGGVVAPAFAAEDPQTDVLATAGDPQIDVTVPLKVVAQVEADGEMTFSTSEYAKVVNNSGFAVKVDKLAVNEASNFKLVATSDEVVAGKLMVTVDANGSGQISLDKFTAAAAAPGASWVMNAANSNTMKLGFEGKAEFDDFDGKTAQEKVFDMVWTFEAA